MPYLEQLPQQCPPESAAAGSLDKAFRLLPDGAPKIEHFYSHQKLGRKLPDGLDSCRFSSCSLFSCESKARAVAALPKRRASFTHVASVKVDVHTGVYMINEKTKHIDLWPYSTFDVAAAVVGVKPL